MRTTFETLRDTFDLVVVAVPPVLEGAFATVLAESVDLILLVGDAQHTTRSDVTAFQIDMTGTNNKGGLITYPAWVISEDIKTVVEPGNYNYEKAINDHGKAMDFLGGYDPKRGVFVISVGGKYQAGNQGELHEVMRLSNEDFDYYFGTSAHNIDEFAARAIGPVNKRTFVDVTTPATSSKAGSVMSIDVNNTRDLGEFMAGFKSLLPHPDIGEGSLRESDGSAIIKNKNSNFIDDAWGVVDSIWPKHAPIREFLTPDEFKPLLSKKSMLDPYYQTVEGKKELRDFSFIVSMGLIGSAPAGLGKGVSFIDDIVRKTPVVKEAYTGLEEFVTPITRSTAAGLNKVGMSREVKPIYDMSVRGAGVARDLEPGVMPVLDLSKTTRINPGATNIVEKELLKGEHTVYGGGAAGAQYKFTTPRVSRDIDAFVTNPELVESRINMRLDKAGLEKEVTDLHAFPEGYPIGRSRVEVEVYDEAPDTGLKLGSRLLGDPIPKVPRSKDILIGGKGELNYEKLNYLAVRKYNAIYEDIAGIESKKSSPALVSRLSNRLGKDALDARLHMTELNMASSSRGESVPGLGKVMGDFDRLYARPIKINIGGVERQTTVGQLAMEESMKFNKAAMPMGKINLNMERSIVTPSIMSSPRSRVASLSFGPSMMKSLSASASSKSMSTSMSIKSPSLPSTSPSVSFKMPSYKPPKLNSRAVSTMSGFSTKSVNPFKSPSSVFKPSTRTRGYGSTSPRPSPRPSTIFKEYSPLSENKKKEGKKDLLGLGENTRWQYSGVFDMGDMFQAPKTHRVKRRRKK
jgi:hypothetical protein